MKKIDFSKKKCMSCEGGTKPFSRAQIRECLKDLKGWAYEKGAIVKTFPFKDYYETVSFVNAVAWIAHTEDHHPDMSFGYKKCRVEYATHAIKGISENDFICAAKVEALI